MRRFVSIECGKNAFSLDERHVFIQVGDWQFFLSLAASCDISHLRTLANGDTTLWSEVVAPDDWRNQSTRPNGLPW